MNSYIFNSAGRCICTVNAPVEQSEYPEASKIVQMEAKFDPELVWFDFEDQQLKFKTPIRPLISINKLSRIPVGTIAVCNGQEFTVEDGDLDLEVDYPQTLKVFLRHPNFLSTAVEVPCEVQG
jgi:hypothetical protein